MQVDFYYDIVCPYAYLASTRVDAVVEAAGGTARWVPVLLGGLLRDAGGPIDPNAAMSAPRARLNILDLHRWADHWRVPLRFHPDHPRRTVAAMRLLVGAGEAVRRRLTAALYRAYWVDGEDVSDRAVLDRIAREHGVDPAVIDTPEARQGLFDTTAEAAGRGAFGVPTFHVDGQLFWGQDRFDFLADALGAARRDWPAAAPGADEGPSTGRGAVPVVRFFHDFSSPWSYLAATQVERVVEAAGGQVEWRPMLLGALFKEVGTANVPILAMSERKRRYVNDELERWARWWGVPFRYNSHFPLRTVAALRIALVAPGATPHLYRAAWAEDRDIADPRVLREVLEYAGFEGAALLPRTADPTVKAMLRENTAAAIAAGACGAPTFEVLREGKPPALFWGQDRLEQVARTLSGWDPP